MKKDQIIIRRADISEIEADALVNAANEDLVAGSGVCGALFEAAGYEELTKACRKIGHCDTGKAVITPAFKAKARYIIHAVGPIWNGGIFGEAGQLRSCYEESLKLATEYGCRRIVFPVISSGIFGYPKEEAWTIALSACRDYLNAHPDHDFEIIFVARSRELTETGERVLKAIYQNGHC